VMSNNVASGKALIDKCCGFSIELDQNNSRSVSICIRAITSFLKGRAQLHSKEYYSIFRKLGFNEKAVINGNFKKSHAIINTKKVSFFPVLFGEKDYDFKCLMAKKTSKSSLIKKCLRS
jgi:hypothetical protein